MIVDVDDNPNCDGCGVMRFQERSLPRRLSHVRVSERGGMCAITGWGPDGAEPARARKVMDSGDGEAWLVYGGEWGLRLAAPDAHTAWGLDQESQWGEAFLAVPGPEDLTFDMGTTS